MDVGKILGELRSGGWKIFAVLFFVALAVVLAAKLFPTTFHEPFPGLVAGAMFLALASGVVLICYGIAYGVAKAAETLRQRRASPSVGALRHRFGRLTQQQKQLLVQVFKSGQRGFDWPHDRLRWLEELSELGFIRWIVPFVIYAGQPERYEITVTAWKAMEQLDKAGRLP